MDLSRYVLVLLNSLKRSSGIVNIDLMFNEFENFFGFPIDYPKLQLELEHFQTKELIIFSKDSIKITPKGFQEAHKTMVSFGFEEGYGISNRSEADKEYLHREHSEFGIIGMTDSEQRSFLVQQLTNCKEPVLDIGCGDGNVTNFLAQKSHKVFGGIDSSKEALDLASSRYPNIGFFMHSMENLPAYFRDVGSIIAIDSLYFTVHLEKVVTDMVGLLKKSPDTEDRKIIILYSTYCLKSREEAMLEPWNNDLGRILMKHIPEPQREVHDFSTSDRVVWNNKREVLVQLKEKYYGEKTAYLFWDRYNEVSFLDEICKEGMNSRFGYVIYV